ncbi:MAG: hypothetical protein AAGI49_18390 [Bacteroidota bacterium]
MKNSFSFSTIKLKELERYFQIDIQYSEKAFEEWFGFENTVAEEEKNFLNDLIQKHRLKLPTYGRKKLKAKFIIPILNKVDFFFGAIDDWYEVNIEHEFEHVILNGKADYVIAEGTRTPKKPYFFLQEFKPDNPDRDPEVQLIAQMITALAENEQDRIKGGFITEQQWRVAILEKKAHHTYQYYGSPVLAALVPEQLYQIYTNLKAVKAALQQL